jgi:peroxiredoxin
MAFIATTDPITPMTAESMNSIRVRHILCLGIVLLFALLAGCEDHLTALPSGNPAPAFTLLHLNGNNVRFPEDYRNKVVAIRFWADWCPYCRNEMGALEPIYRQYHDRGLYILAINVMQPQAVVQDFIDQVGISYEVLLDSQGEVMRRYGAMGLPMTFVVDRNGIIRARIIGESTPQAFERIILELLY